MLRITVHDSPLRELEEFWQSTLARQRKPILRVDLSGVTFIDAAGKASLDGGAARSPFPGGMQVRMEKVWPDHDLKTTEKVWVEINKLTGHIQTISEKDRQRSPSMHRTNSLDVMTILSGEIYLILDEGEILLKPTDTLILQGVNHGWSNRGKEPCLFTAVMIDAIPRQ